MSEHFEQNGEHEADADEEVEGAEGDGQLLVVAGQTAEPGGKGEALLYDQASRQEPRLASGCLTTSNWMP